jgi:uncharacterized protein YciI
MFIVTLTYIRPLEELDALMDAHIAWLKKHYASGLFVASGRQVPRKGGVILARSGDRDGLQAVLARDPFVLNGVARADILEFVPSMTALGRGGAQEPFCSTAPVGPSAAGSFFAPARMLRAKRAASRAVHRRLSPKGQPPNCVRR